LEHIIVEHEFFKEYKQGPISGLFYLIFISNILVNIDHGSMPACSVAMKKDLNMNNAKFGLLGSIVYGGMTLGSTVATGVYEKAHLTKFTLAITLALNAICLTSFAYIRNFYVDVLLRFLIGCF
jgi:sugar phosphate permease